MVENSTCGQLQCSIIISCLKDKYIINVVVQIDMKGVDVYDPPHDHPHISVLTARLCNRWAQRALLPLSRSL